MNLIHYIAVNHSSNQREFAKAQGVKPPQVTQWIVKNFIVVDHVLYAPRRKLNRQENK